MKKRTLNYYHLFSIIYLLVVVLTSYGCTEVNTDKKDTKYVLINGYSPLKIVEVNSYEYLFGEWNPATVLTHKGNCKFCTKINSSTYNELFK